MDHANFQQWVSLLKDIEQYKNFNVKTFGKLKSDIGKINRTRDARTELSARLQYKQAEVPGPGGA